MELEKELNRGLDYIIDQLEHGNTIEGLKKGREWMSFEQVKEWKSKYGFKFYIYSNDHLIDNKPHFHLINKSKKIDCRLFFNGLMHDCKDNYNISKKVKKALNYFLTKEKNQKLLIQFWNFKNPDYQI